MTGTEPRPRPSPRAVPGTEEVLVIRPKPARRALFVVDGEGPDEARRRRLQAVPFLLVALAGVGYWFADSVHEHGVQTALAMWGGVLGTVALLVAVMTAAERPRSVRVTADELVIERRLGRRSRHPRSEIQTAETTRVVVGRVADQQVTFVLGAPRRRLVRLLGPRRRVLLTLSRQHWEGADIDALIGRLGVRHVVHHGEVLIMAQVRRRYRRAFVVTTRRPFLSGVVLAALLLAGLFAVLWTFA